ncbi:MAG: hypothetical protein LBP92_12685 [Deltaproteobacteria bacterium]|nr:hypothetical protein [Deltaproteobacteria bacterium]
MLTGDDVPCQHAAPSGRLDLAFAHTITDAMHQAEYALGVGLALTGGQESPGENWRSVGTGLDGDHRKAQ